MDQHLRLLGLAVLFGLLLPACSGDGSALDQAPKKPSALRIASLHGTATQWLYAFGLEEALVLRDVTSTYPPEVKEVASAGHVSQIGLEGLLKAAPDMVLCTDEVSEELRSSLVKSGIEVLLLPKPSDLLAGKTMGLAIAERFSIDRSLVEQRLPCFPENGEVKKASDSALRALFLYGNNRTSGVLAAGDDTAPAAFIRASGLQNAAEGQMGFQAITPEALIEMNPEVLVFFEHSFRGLGGMEGLRAIPGLSATTAALHEQVLVFPSHELNGFGPHACATIARLSEEHELLRLVQLEEEP